MKRGTVTVDTALNLHATPNGEIIGHLYNGAPIYILGSEQRPQRKWLHIKETGIVVQEGWVDSRFVKIDEDTVLLPTARPDAVSSPMTIAGIAVAVAAIVIAFVSACLWPS